jgi:DNA-directed RNA polymerase specialized sigma24 family protein
VTQATARPPARAPPVVGGVILVAFGNASLMDAVPLLALEREWRMLVRGRLGSEFRRWKVAEPALARFNSPDRLIRFLWDKQASPVEKDRLLAALLRSARTESSASRVVLQAMLPALKVLSAEFLRRDPDREGEPALEREELWQVLFVAMLERIKTYPLDDRPRKIAANLRWDTKHAVLPELDRARSARHDLPKDEPLEPVGESAPYMAEDVEAPLRRAVAARAISQADADLLLWVDVDRVSLRLAAERLGISYNAAKHRRQRARRALLMFLRPWTHNIYVRDDPKGALDRPSSGAYAPEALEDTAEQAG